MSDTEDKVNHHAAELLRHTMTVADQGPTPLPEDELAKLGMLIATERQMLIDSMGELLAQDDPDAAARPGVAEFDAGFVYGLLFARAIDDVKTAVERVRRGRIIHMVKRKNESETRAADD